MARLRPSAAGPNSPLASAVCVCRAGGIALNHRARHAAQVFAPRAACGGWGGWYMTPRYLRRHPAPPGRAVPVLYLPKQQKVHLKLSPQSGEIVSQKKYRPGTHRHPPGRSFGPMAYPNPPWAFPGPAAPARPASENRPCMRLGPIWTPIDKSMRHRKYDFFESGVPYDGWPMGN